MQALLQPLVSIASPSSHSSPVYLYPFPQTLVTIMQVVEAAIYNISGSEAQLEHYVFNGPVHYRQLVWHAKQVLLDVYKYVADGQAVTQKPVSIFR